MGLWWGWDAIIDIWMRRDMPWMEVRYDLDGGEACILGPWWNLGTWMEVRRYMDVGETRILGPGCRWERNWKHLTSTFWDLGLRVWGDLKTAQTTSRIQLSWPGLRWDVTWIVVRCEYRDLDGRGKGEGEMRIFVLRWNLNGTQKGVTQKNLGD